MSETNFSDFLEDIKGNLNEDSQENRSDAISEGIANLKSKIKDVEVKTPEAKVPSAPKETKVKDSTSLADRAIDTYKTKLAPPIDAPTSLEDVLADPSTIASRESIKAITRSLTGMRSSGNAGKTSPVPPSGNGNVSSAGGGNYYANQSSLSLESKEETLEEYQARIMEAFSLLEGEKVFPLDKVADKLRKVAKERDGEKDIEKKNKLASRFSKMKSEYDLPEETAVDLIGILEEALLESGASDWQSIDAVTRQVCSEHNITPKELNREFKAQHGAYPDKWITENLEVEECGFFPLYEATLMHKVGIVYDVSFVFRGGTQRFKFFWPNAMRPTMVEMQQAVELFYPKARLLAFYPSSNQGSNQMVVVPPMSENFQVFSQDDWVALSEADIETLEVIAEEVGEPITSPVLQEDGTYEVLVSDHDTGEATLIVFGEMLGLGKKKTPEEIRTKKINELERIAKHLSNPHSDVAHKKVKTVKEGAAWTKKSGQNSEGGLNEKGRKSYERENPGSDLKRPQPEGGKRRDSYCARSKGQQDMHNIDCSKDPDKRICKARKKWDC